MTNFSVSVGKSAKYMYKWLSSQDWEKYLQTYSGADVNAIWQSVEVMCSLFVETSTWVAAELNYEYNDTEANNGMYFLQSAKDLPKDASEVL